MRIGIYYHAQLFGSTGGGAVFQESIIAEIRKIDFHHEIYLFSPVEPGYPLETLGEIRFIKLDSGMPELMRKASKVFHRVTNAALEKLFDREVAVSGPLENAVREHRIDLLWFISTSTEKVTIPYMATVWDLAHRVHPYFPEVSVTDWKWMDRERHYRELLPRAACVLTGTETGKEEIIRFYQLPDHLVQVVPFPTPQFALDHPTPGETPADHDDLPKKFLFYPAQFWPHKNHVGLLLAMKILREKYGLDFNLVLTGSDQGNLGYVREKAEDLRLADRVTFQGFVDTDVLRRLYRRAFALVYPTFFGPDNLPPLEAFALGCPVIASHVAGADEQLGSAALLFNPKDPGEMAQRVKDLHDSPSRREEMITLGRERALRWTAANYVERVFGIIDDFEPIRRCWSSREPHRHK